MAEYWTVSEIAKKEQLSEGVICKFAAEGSFRAGVFINHIVFGAAVEPYNGLAFLTTADLLILVNADSVNASGFHGHDGENIRLPSGWQLAGLDGAAREVLFPNASTAKLTSSIKISRSAILVDAEELLSFKNNNSGLFGINAGWNKKSVNAPIATWPRLEAETGHSRHSIEGYAKLCKIEIRKNSKGQKELTQDEVDEIRKRFPPKQKRKGSRRKKNAR